MARFCLLFFALIWASAVHAKTHQPVLWNVPISHTSFWGRKAQLIELEQKLTKGPVVVTGLSGIGKSRLAFTYAKKHAHTYKLVWVFDASQGMDKQMIDFANKLYASQNKGKMGSFARAEEASHYAKTLLRTCAFSWLLIFDGAETFAKVEETIPETFQTQGKHVLVSSLSDKGVSGVLRLEALSDAEAHDFLKHYLKDASDADIKHLAKVLANHPLAMVQAANYINATPGMNVDAYIAFFTKSKQEYWASESKALQGQSLLFTAIKMSIDKLKEASPKDYTALVALCLLNTHEIDRPMIGKIYAQLTGGDMAGFGKIMDVALISRFDTNTYAVHDYVRDVVLATADRATLKETATLDARIFLALFPEKIEDCVGVFEKDPALVGHLKELMTHVDLMEKNDAFTVGVRLFYYGDAVMRDYANATLWGNQLETLFQSGEIEDPYLKAVFKSYYGDTRVMTDGIDVSLAQYRQAAPFFEQVDPVKARAEHVMFLANNLGYFLHYKGEIDEASQCLEQAKVLLGAQRDIFPQSAIDELEITLNIDAGRFEQAMHVADRELTMLDTDPVFKKVTGHFVESLKACALLKQAQFEALNNNEKEAKALRVQALQVAKDAHKHAVESSDGNADTAVVGRTLLYLSQAQSALGHAKEAQENAQKAIKIFAGHYPNEMAHPRQAVAHMALGDALSAQGKHEKAKDAYLKAEAIFDALATKKAFDDMSEVWARLVDNAIVRGDANTARRCLAAHKATFDGLHPRYIMMAAKVASV